MQRTHFIPQLAISGIILFLLAGCAKRQLDETPAWGGSITQEDQVTVVNNPDTPFYGEIELLLEEDLSIGDENDENTLFYNASRLALDDAENIYVLDAGNHRVQKFNKFGNFLLTIGKEGQGPGELDRASGLRLDINSHIFTMENMRIQQFAPTGEFVKSISLTTRLMDFCLTSSDHFFGIEVQNTDEGRRRFLQYYDHEGKQIKTVAQYGDVKVVQRKMEGGARMSFAIRHTFNPVLVLAPSIDHKLIYAFTADYSLYRIHENGSPDIIIRKEEAKKTITQAEKDEIIERVKEQISRMSQNWPDDVIEEGLQFPLHSPFFSHLVTDEKGRIYTRRIKSPLDDSGREELDIFSVDGYYLYRAILPHSPQVIRNGFLYRADENEESGEIKIKRYRITNWDELKSEILNH